MSEWAPGTYDPFGPDPVSDMEWTTEPDTDVDIDSLSISLDLFAFLVAKGHAHCVGCLDMGCKR